MIFSGLITKMYKKTLFRRMDERPDCFYFTYKDFDGLHEESFPFEGERGQMLAGHFYFRDGAREDRIVVFEHGMGAGHRSYMREIDTICRHGYKVFTYDRTGCADSEGESIRGFAGALSDADYAMRALRADPRYTNVDVSVIGHSWGGYTTQNICAYHKDIRHVVAIAGFPSVSLMLDQQLKGLLKHFRGDVMALEHSTSPDYADSTAVNAVSGCDVKALFIHSVDDHIVDYNVHMKHLMENLAHNDRVRFITVDGKQHNPTYAKNAVDLLRDYHQKREALEKKKGKRTPEEYKAFVDSFDWWAMTEQDESIWKEIFDFIDG